VSFLLCENALELQKNDAAIMIKYKNLFVFILSKIVDISKMNFRRISDVEGNIISFS
jgi:hypothetical protein